MCARSDDDDGVLYGSETQLSRTEDVQRLSLFEHCRSRRDGKIWRGNVFSNLKVGLRTLCHEVRLIA